MTYIRVIPRDFFNESKLLKCLGKLELCIHDNSTNDLPLVSIFDGERFIIELSDYGFLYCLNYKVFVNDIEIYLYTPYNNRDNYPLYGDYKENTYKVFDESGQLNIFEKDFYY